MLIYKNINGEEEAVSEDMVVRFSRKEDVVFNELKPITLIHLKNLEQIKTLNEMKTLITQMINEKNVK